MLNSLETNLRYLQRVTEEKSDREIPFRLTIPARGTKIVSRRRVRVYLKECRRVIHESIIKKGGYPIPEVKWMSPSSEKYGREPDDGLLALGTPERREQEEYFDKRTEENNELSD